MLRIESREEARRKRWAAAAGAGISLAALAAGAGLIVLSMCRLPRSRGRQTRGRPERG